MGHRFIESTEVDALTGEETTFLTCPVCGARQRWDHEGQRGITVTLGEMATVPHTILSLPSRDELRAAVGDEAYEAAEEAALIDGRPLLRLELGDDAVAEVGPCVEKT